jgi:NAD(P)-dependent dehydrogenase (short-subunit alcohol dehydrogenase family)
MPRLNKPTILLTAGGLGLLLATRAVVRRYRQYDLRDKVVLITGGSRGLGLIMARQLLDQGARIAICARDGAELERARSDLGRNNERVFTVPCDITDQGQVQAMVHGVHQHFDRIDVLINNDQ